ncbi:MAG: hypothetical protein JSU08_00420 [Acidobacteria bacterium]|nr:hypothetical protein [Acidobacteriota bacterium]
MTDRFTKSVRPERTTRSRRLLGVCLAVACSVAAGPSLHAQGVGRGRQELVAKLTGKPVKVDERTRRRRAISEDEATVLVDQIARLTAPATPAGSPQALSKGGLMLRLSDHGAGHVLVSRPNEDGTTSVRCVTSAAEAVDFLSGDLDEAFPLQ